MPEEKPVPHYSLAQVEASWNVSSATVRRISAPLPGGIQEATETEYIMLSISERIMKAQLALLRKAA